MARPLLLLVLAALAAAPAALAQSSPADWQPPSRSMPAMPQMAALQADWRGAVDGAWQDAMAQLSGLPAEGMRAVGETSGGSARAKFVRFAAGYRPAATWTDRNGDGACDLVELFRDGARVVQLVDADYDGAANVVRVYAPSGALVAERQL